MSSDAPIFQRVIRSDREEFELLHDLLGTILLDWRQEYQAALASRMDSRMRRTEAQAQQQADNLMLRPGEPGFTEQGQRLILSIRPRKSRCTVTSSNARREQPSSSSDSAKRPIGSFLRALVEALKLKMEFDDYYEIETKLDEAYRAIGPVMFPLALDDPSEQVRRTFQKRIQQFWTTASHAGLARLRASRKSIAWGVAAVIFLTIASVVLAGLVFAGPVDALGFSTSH